MIDKGTQLVTPYIIFTLAFAASAALPGPEIAALLSRSLSGGMRNSFYLAAGIIIGKLLMLSAALLGVTALLTLLGPAFSIVKWVGAAYLVWLGIRRWRKAGTPIDIDAAQRPRRNFAEMGLGVAMTVSNPLALAFYMALLPTVINVSGVSMASYLLLCIIIVAVMAAVVLGYGAIGELSRKVFRSPRAKANIDRVSGVIMIGVGTMIACR